MRLITNKGLTPPLFWLAIATNRFVYNGWNLVRERIADRGSPIANSYCWGLDLSGTLQGAGGIGGLLAASGLSTNVLAYFYDANGNVGQLLDTNAVVRAHYEYGPFGDMLVMFGDMAQANPFRFSTKYVEAGGLCYYGYRYYSSELGRWLSRDPIGERGGKSLCSFVRNSPCRYVDALGLVTFSFGSGCTPDEKKKFTDLSDRYMKTLEKAIELLGVPDTGGGAVGTAHETAMAACFGASPNIAGYELALNQVRRNLLKVKNTFNDKVVKIECKPCGEDTGGTLMWGHIPLTNMRIDNKWIDEADAATLAQTLLHESLHEYAGLNPGREEWYYAGGSWSAPDGSMRDGVVPPTNVAVETPAAYACLFGRCW